MLVSPKKFHPEPSLGSVVSQLLQEEDNRNYIHTNVLLRMIKRTWWDLLYGDLSLEKKEGKTDGDASRQGIRGTIVRRVS